MNIKDIAKKAGVSTATVSRALNNPEKVRQDTLEKVMKIVDDNHYSLNPFARNLASPGKTNNVVLIVPNTINPFFSQLASGAESLFDEYGYYLHIYNIQKHFVERPERIREILEDFGNESFFDGLILAGSNFFNSTYLKTIPKIKKPVVVIEPTPDNNQLDCVLVDERTGIWLAFEHLKKRKHETLGIIHGGEILDLTIRKMQYISEFHKDFSLKMRPEWNLASSYDSLEASYQVMNRFLASSQPYPSVFFCFNDIIAMGATRAILDNGLKIPQDIAILGSDDILMSKYLNPTLTSIKTPTEDLGKTAARVLLNKMTNPNLPPQRIYLPPTLIVRESC